MRPSHAIVIGSGVVGLLSSLLLAKRNWRVRLVDESVNRPLPHELPYICSHLVTDFLSTEAPEVLAALRSNGAREISIAEILRSRFPDTPVTARDRETSFLCCSRSLLQRILLERVRAHGLEIVEGRVDSLVKNGGRIEGVRMQDGGTFDAPLVVDATGTVAPRARWLEDLGIEPDLQETAGPRYVSLAKFYRKSPSTPPVSFALASGRNFRGGIYPLENDRFAIALVVPETTPLEDPERFFDAALAVIPGASRWLDGASTWDRGLQIVRGIGNRASSFYESRDLKKELRGFFPLGDSVLCGNPIYGRGISFAISQIADFVSALDEPGESMDDVRDRIAKGLRRLRPYWADGAFADRADAIPDRASVKTLRFLRDTYVTNVISQLETSPDLTRNFLYNYQLSLPAWRITGPRQVLNAIRHFRLPRAAKEIP